LKKFFLLLFFIFLFLTAFIAFLFTPVGNSFLKPIVENQINTNSPVKVTLDKFRVGFNFLDIKICFFKNSKAEIRGVYSLFNRNFNFYYYIHLHDLNNLKSIVNYPLRGSVDTNGNIKGNLQNIKINGVTNLAKSDSNYFVDIKNKKISKILANIKNLDVASLLYIVNKPEFINGKLYSDIKLNSIDLNNLDGNIQAYIKHAVINRGLFKREYNLTLPKTILNLNSVAILKGKKIDFFANLISNLAKISINGLFKNNYLNAKYNVNIDNLSVLTPIINQKIRGNFKTKGRVEGNINNLILKGIAYLAKGNIKYLSKLNKKEISFIIDRLKIERLFYMLYQPIFSYGYINSKVNLIFDKNINGEVIASIKGITNKYVLYKEFNFSNAKISYNLNSNVNIRNSVAFIKSKLNSSILKANFSNSKYDINKDIFVGSYMVNVPNLDKLYFATHKHLKGKIKIIGNVKKDKDLLITGSSKTLGGKVNYKLLNNNFSLSAQNVYVLNLLDMLMYPKIFDSTANINLKYDLLHKKGYLKASLLNGRFLPNSFTRLIKSLIHFDLTKEVYENTTINSVIDNKKLINDLDMKSKLTHISSKKALVNLEKEYINAKLLLEINKKPVFVKLKGKLTKPKIKIDANRFLKSKIKNKLKKEIKKRVNKEFEKKLQLDKLLKMF
jgi:hypothetical protein